MIFLAHCPNKIGLVAMISKFFKENNLDITTLEEHAEREYFFIRIKTPNTKDNEIIHIKKEFSVIAKYINMKFKFFKNDFKTKIGLFCSSTLHCPLEVLSQKITGNLPIEISFIVSNKKNFSNIAKTNKIPFYYVPTKDNTDYEGEQLKIIKKYSPDLIALARYMKVLSPLFLSQCPIEIINIHHSFLPSFIGNKPYEMAYKRGVKIIGATAHFVTEELDQGPIITQNILPINHRLSIKELKTYGSNTEKMTFIEAIEKFTKHKVITHRGRTVIFS